MPSFVDIAEGPRHSIGVTTDGLAFSWRKSNNLGQLGRDTDAGDATTTCKKKEPGRVPLPLDVKVKHAFVSSHYDADSGHSAILDSNNQLWVTGCDRWQQLGLGSSKGGSTGYAWKELWQERFVPSPFVTELMKQDDSKATIRDVSLGVIIRWFYHPTSALCMCLEKAAMASWVLLVVLSYRRLESRQSFQNLG